MVVFQRAAEGRMDVERNWEMVSRERELYYLAGASQLRRVSIHSLESTTCLSGQLHLESLYEGSPVPHDVTPGTQSLYLLRGGWRDDSGLALLSCMRLRDKLARKERYPPSA